MSKPLSFLRKQAVKVIKSYLWKAWKLSHLVLNAALMPHRQMSRLQEGNGNLCQNGTPRGIDECVFHWRSGSARLCDTWQAAIVKKTQEIVSLIWFIELFPLIAPWIPCDHKKTWDILAVTSIANLHVHLDVSWPPEAQFGDISPDYLIVSTSLFFW